MSEWKKTRLGDVISTNIASYSTKEGWEFVNYLDTGNITENVIADIQRINLSTEKLPSRAKRKVQYNSILYSTVRPNQRHYGIVKESPENFLVSTGFTVIDVDEEKVDADFLYFLLTQDSLVELLHSIAEQSVSAYPSIKASDIENLEVELPPLIEQKKIASILNTISDKMRQNTEVNKNLEEQAVMLFRSWFSAFSLSPNSPRVNSEFGEIPEDFAVVKVGSLPMLVTDYVANGSFASLKANVNLYQEPNYAYFIRNTDLKSGSFGVFVDQHSYEFLSKSTLYGGEIIISNVGDVGSVFLCPKLDGRMTLGNNIIMLRPEDDHLRYYLYIWFKYFQGQALIQGIKGGSAQPKFNKTDFKNTSVLIPPKDILTRFHETVAPMFETISQRQAETSRLADLRDTLLPQLMSGEIDVSDLDL
jgi:type I restriction enzyme S subunit